MGRMGLMGPMGKRQWDREAGDAEARPPQCDPWAPGVPFSHESHGSHSPKRKRPPTGGSTGVEGEVGSREREPTRLD